MFMQTRIMLLLMMMMFVRTQRVDTDAVLRDRFRETKSGLSSGIA